MSLPASGRFGAGALHFLMKGNGMLRNLVFLMAMGLASVVTAQELPAFGRSAAVPARTVKPIDAKTLAIDCFSPGNAGRWMVETPRASAVDAFTIAPDAGMLQIRTGQLDPGRSTVRILLPGDGPANGALWQRNRATSVSFLCRSDRRVNMTFHLLQRGKSAGTHQAAFIAEPGEWQRIVLPITSFGLKSFSSIAGIGFRTAGEESALVSVKDLTVGSVPFNDDSWKSHRVAISIDGDWRFAPDGACNGLDAGWHADGFDDSAWRTLKSGQSWQEQGVSHYGWGWYRQKLFVPKELEGIPLTLTLCAIPSDDDTWFNGTRIGGISSEYKYRNWLTRVYVVPPASIRYGAENTIALRIWGGHITFIGNRSGLVKGPMTALFDPYRVHMRRPGAAAVPAERFDLSEAQRGQPFELLFRFPAELAAAGGATLRYRLNDYAGAELAAGTAPLTTEAGVAEAAIAIGRELAQVLYFRGRFQATLLVEDAQGAALYTGTRDIDQLSFAARDLTPLPALPETTEQTPYGTLRLIDEIDCANPVFDEIHPYMQGGYNNILNHLTPGSHVEMHVRDILGRKAREPGYGWFAYRIGRGKLKPRSTYLLRIEYPEDKPRFVPVEVQVGQNFMDIGWKNGVGADDVYDPWPLSQRWQWYDAIIPLDDQTTGTGGTGSAPAENGFWVYFMNKQKPGQYYAMWEGGAAIGRIKLYEIDPDLHAPVIRRPEGLPQRILSLDFERQADHDPADLVRYAKLMGYNAISPIMLKWFFANYSDPINGYSTIVIDERDYWAQKTYDPAGGEPAASPWPGRPSQHIRYLEATKRYGINYIPRIEWGGSQDVPREAWAVDHTGKPTKPNRFAPWCVNLLHPAAWDDLERYIEHLIKPHVKDNPQLTGVLWRIRCFRLPISYGAADLELFSKETGIALPPGRYEQWVAWAVGEGKAQYDDWWHRKRADFHARLANLLRSYREDMMLYYFNWDPDKIGIIEPDITAWAFVQHVVKPPPEGGRAAYEKERAVRRSFTASDYLSVLHSGNFGRAYGGLNRADLAIRPALYRGVKGIQLFAPAHYFCYADMPDYLNYFAGEDGLAVSHTVSYDEIGSRTINPKYEANMITPGGPAFAMALELLAWFHGDARTLNYTVYTYGRGFADAHRRFAQAFLALPAIDGTTAPHPDADVKVRLYPAPGATYVGIGHKGMAPKRLTITLPGAFAPDATVQDLVTGQTRPAHRLDSALRLEIESGPMELHALVVR